MPYLSIVIPAYNEAQRIGGTLDALHAFVAAKPYPIEVIVVDDGSSDDTVGIAERSTLAKEGKVRVIRNSVNHGKGFSVRAGILASAGNYILFSDADLSTPIEELDRFFGYLSEGYVVVIGSRGLAASQVKVHQPWYREIMGKTFNLFVKILLMHDFNDTQCGFKLFTRAAALAIAQELTMHGFSFDVEMLYLAVKKGYKIKEAPVTWLNSPKSKVNPLFDSAAMFVDLVRIRMRHG